ncbi:malonyl-CoA decarboxylase, mitochondrial-like [Centruroides vittatus]|uniref:malonyl-CoA decarboxylase, mitochondrial-like n=1 Tax=Centruroides vittatus TaxID=120091 RepID=UPI003510CE1F
MLGNKFFYFLKNISYNGEIRNHINKMVSREFRNIHDLTKSIVSGASTVSVDAKARQFCMKYVNLSSEEKKDLFIHLTKYYGVDHNLVLQMSQTIVSNKDKGECFRMRAEEKLKTALMPSYQELFSRIGRLEKGVKFLVDLRTDLLDLIALVDNIHPYFYQLKALNATLRDLLSLWFSVGFLQLERVTWDSSCDMLQKISEYEAVHPMRSWTDLKSRVGLYRRCYVFTHSSMPKEPVVVLHTALTNEIASSIQSIVVNQRMHSEGDISLTLNRLEDPKNISAAIFYSITSTQRGLQGIELGTQLIKRVVQEILTEFPHLTQFSTLSPIPGFKTWLMLEIQKYEKQEQTVENFFTNDELSILEKHLVENTYSVIPRLKKLLSSNSWINDEILSNILHIPLMRICAHYLYKEKRRGYALNNVANFHLRNGAVLWRLNWKADLSPRGLDHSCGMMVNYRYFLDKVEEFSCMYVEKQEIEASDQFIQLLKPISFSSSL